MNSNTFCTPDHILADVLKAVDDERFEINTKGWYISQIQQALEEMAFQSFFDEQEASFTIPENRNILIPSGLFNINQIYGFNGDTCDITRSQKIWHKRNFNTKGNGYFARNKGNNGSDPFYDRVTGNMSRAAQTSRQSFQVGVENHYFYNVQNGIIMLSAKCADFQNIYILFNGTGCDIGDIPIIPNFLRQYVKDYTTEIALRMRLAKDRSGSWSQLWKITESKLNQQYDGSAAKAKRFIAAMDNNEREDLSEYLSKSAW